MVARDVRKRWRLGMLFKGDRATPSSTGAIERGLDLLPVMRTSPDATHQRAGLINWRPKQFIRLEVDGLIAPFAKQPTRAIHISDVELLAIVLGLLAWVEDFDGTAPGHLITQMHSDGRRRKGRISEYRCKYFAPLRCGRSKEWAISRACMPDRAAMCQPAI